MANRHDRAKDLDNRYEAQVLELREPLQPAKVKLTDTGLPLTLEKAYHRLLVLLNWKERQWHHLVLQLCLVLEPGFWDCGRCPQGR